MVPITAFDKALDFTLRWEGGYVNDSSDPGGETKFGISKRAYPNEDIKNLTRERAAEIYKRDYWDGVGCGTHPLGDSVALFDSAVNCGVAKTAIWLDTSKNWKDLLEYRKLYYKRLVEKKPLMTKFLKGWLNRVDALISYIHKIEENTKQ